MSEQKPSTRGTSVAKAATTKKKVVRTAKGTKGKPVAKAAAGGKRIVKKKVVKKTSATGVVKAAETEVKAATPAVGAKKVAITSAAPAKSGAKASVKKAGVKRVSRAGKSMRKGATAKAAVAKLAAKKSAAEPVESLPEEGSDAVTTYAVEVPKESTTSDTGDVVEGRTEVEVVTEQFDEEAENVTSEGDDEAGNKAADATEKPISPVALKKTSSARRRARTTTKKQPPMGLIIGGVLGGIVAVGGLIALFAGGDSKTPTSTKRTASANLKPVKAQYKSKKKDNMFMPPTYPSLPRTKEKQIFLDYWAGQNKAMKETEVKFPEDGGTGLADQRKYMTDRRNFEASLEKRYRTITANKFKISPDHARYIGTLGPTRGWKIPK